MTYLKDIALLHLKNENFCSLSNALTYARTSKDLEVWKTIINRSDLDNKSALQIAEELDNPEIWKFITNKIDIKSCSINTH